MSKYYVFTINNYTQETIDKLQTVECAFLVYGKEIGEETKTPHLQGYIEFELKKKRSTVCNLLGGKCWVDYRRGTQSEAIKYCEKDGDFFRKGEPTISNQGKRTDLEISRILVKEGGMRLLTAKGKTTQGIVGARMYLSYNEEPRNWKPTVTWIYGETGVGKSWEARKILGEKDLYTKNDGKIWWEGYDAHENVILDDFRDSWWSLTEMLSLLDRYEKRIEHKGGIRQFRARNIVVTSIHHPSTCYRGCSGEPIEQLLRRIDRIVHLTQATPAPDENSEVNSKEIAVPEVENVQTPGWSEGLIDNIDDPVG